MFFFQEENYSDTLSLLSIEFYNISTLSFFSLIILNRFSIFVFFVDLFRWNIELTFFWGRVGGIDAALVGVAVGHRMSTASTSGVVLPRRRGRGSVIVFCVSLPLLAVGVRISRWRLGLLIVKAVILWSLFAQQSVRLLISVAIYGWIHNIKLSIGFLAMNIHTNLYMMWRWTLLKRWMLLTIFLLSGIIRSCTVISCVRNTAIHSERKIKANIHITIEWPHSILNWHTYHKLHFQELIKHIIMIIISLTSVPRLVAVHCLPVQLPPAVAVDCCSPSADRVLHVVPVDFYLWDWRSHCHSQTSSSVAVAPSNVGWPVWFPWSHRTQRLGLPRVPHWPRRLPTTAEQMEAFLHIRQIIIMEHRRNN